LLSEEARLRERIEALDSLDAYFMNGRDSTPGGESIEPESFQRANTIRAKLEAANSKVYEKIRAEIRRGAGREALLAWTNGLRLPAGEVACASGESYDDLDDLISGVFQFDEPNGDGLAQLEKEMVFYQPTPARHIFDLLARAALTERDLLIDLGSGLGHVPLLVSVFTGARSIGIEREAVYVNCARKSAEALHLKNVSILQQDARAADLSRGTVFYLYTPFTGSILRSVLDSIRAQAAHRKIKVCTFGPCTAAVAQEPWLHAAGVPEPARIHYFLLAIE